MLPSNWNWALDGWIVAAGVLCAVSSTLLGNFLVLRKLSLLGDAITHAVLPGLAVAFLISGTRTGWPMFLGAMIVGVLTAFFTEWIRGVGKVDEGASMGVVFTSLFALGLVIIVQAADAVDLDQNCVLYGAIESTPWDTWQIGEFEVPKAVVTLAGTLLLNSCFVLLFYKELKITSFDPALATSIGFNAALLHYGLMVLVAITAVASFESVGSVLVVAMLVVPAAAAYMLTDRLRIMIVLSVLIAAASAILGHISAIVVPGWFGLGSTITSGMMAVVAGCFFVLCAMFGPRHGFVVRWVHQQWLVGQIISDDVLAYLFRTEEKNPTQPAVLPQTMKGPLLLNAFSLHWALFWLARSGQILGAANGYQLSDQGRQRARGLVRSHRLWEQYLLEHADLESDRIHDKAEKLEHFTNQELRSRLDAATLSPTRDPHGSQIPQEDD